MLTAVGGGGGGGGGGAIVVVVVVVVVGVATVHPDSRATVAAAVPSLTSTVQSAGAE
jgi:hypothetical protein